MFDMTERPPTPSDELWIFIGKNFVTDYVNFALGKLRGKRKIVIKGRGLSIPDAVSVAEILKRKLNREATVTIGSFETENKFKKRVYVSEIIIEIAIDS